MGDTFSHEAGAELIPFCTESRRLNTLKLQHDTLDELWTYITRLFFLLKPPTTHLLYELQPDGWYKMSRARNRMCFIVNHSLALVMNFCSR